ncbi:MAG: ribokinase [Planctomycetota bacterium]
MNSPASSASPPRRPRVINLGSLNADLVYRVPTIVAPGQTLASADFARHAGGKGLNQSVALARAGATVHHVGAVGEDGRWLRDALADVGADVSGVAVLGDHATGHAIIQVDDVGENAIVLFGGANRRAAFDPSVHGLGPGDWLLTQNETSGAPEAIAAAKAGGASVAFNPAPMDDAVRGYPLEAVDLLVVNQSEAEALGDAAGRTLAAGGAVVTTYGPRGAAYRCGDETLEVPAEPADAVDTTAAGDTFVGYFLASRVAGLAVEPALRRAAKAAALCVGRPGAMPSIPLAAEVDA